MKNKLDKIKYPDTYKLINSIANRIKSEYRKHKKLDWSLIAAIKIYSEFIEKQGIFISDSEVTRIPHINKEDLLKIIKP